MNLILIVYFIQFTILIDLNLPPYFINTLQKKKSMYAPGSSRPERLPGHGCTMPVPPINLGGLNDRSKPRVLISGGGIGGLTLAILLHKASIPFLVLEKAKEIKPLGKYI